MRIGIDFGNVICGGGGEDTSFFSDNYLSTPELEGAYDSIFNLLDHEVHVISKCGKRVEDKTMDWLYEHEFNTLLLPQNIHFVRKRPLKAPMCQALELDIFIDDRQDIIDSLKGIVTYPILFESWEQTNKRLEEIFNDHA